MTRNIILSAMLLIASVFVNAQTVVSTNDQANEDKPIITFEKTEHNFGKINEADGRVTTVFNFKNEGRIPLVLTNVKASCGCTTPKWTKTPVEPGATGTIEVTYNPNGRPGSFSKTVTITSNATEGTKRIYIKGEVIPKSAKPVNKYPVQMGDLSLAANNTHFGTILKGSTATKTIDYTNNTDKELSVDIRPAKEGAALIMGANLPTIQKGQVGKLELIFDAAACKLYGPQTYEAYVIVNGEGFGKEENKITLKVNVEEDFSKLTPEQKQKAPIMEVAQEINLGTITPGKAVKKAFNIKNAGVDPMYIRCLINNNEDLFTANATTKAVKGGKTAQVTIKIDGMKNGEKCSTGNYRRNLTIMTNDPKTPKKIVVLVWTIE